MACANSPHATVSQYFIPVYAMVIFATIAKGSDLFKLENGANQFLRARISS